MHLLDEARLQGFHGGHIRGNTPRSPGDTGRSGCVGHWLGRRGWAESPGPNQGAPPCAKSGHADGDGLRRRSAPRGTSEGRRRLCEQDITPGRTADGHPANAQSWASTARECLAGASLPTDRQKNPLCLKSLFRFEESLQLPNARGVPHLAERFSFYLANSFACDFELFAHFFQRARITVTQPEAQL